MKEFKFNRCIARLCRWIEMAMSVFIIILIIISCGFLVAEVIHDPMIVKNASRFGLFLEDILYFVMGIEMVKLLTTHKMKDVLDLIIFALARHMLVTDTSMMENLIQIVGICLVFLIRAKMLKDESRFGESVDLVDEDPELEDWGRK